MEANDKYSLMNSDDRKNNGSTNKSLRISESRKN